MSIINILREMKNDTSEKKEAYQKLLNCGKEIQELADWIGSNEHLSEMTLNEYTDEYEYDNIDFAKKINLMSKKREEEKELFSKWLELTNSK